MTPNDLDAYLAVLVQRGAGAAAIELPGGAKFSVSFIPTMPVQLGTEPEPGGWKSPRHLDDPDALRGEEYKGTLP
jgi:hypothetical protein